jgi:NAD(P)-dependent dehydrogenase (short-subunit alcohol dehydrogenase family)
MATPAPQGDLAGRTALVTGGTGVIGNAIARALATAGADLVIVARRRAPLEAAAEVLAADTGRRVIALTADVGDPASVRSLLQEAAGAVAAIDVLVNNTFAIGGERPIVDLDVDDWDEPWRVNVIGPFLLSQACARRMMEGNGGSIVNILTTAAFLPLSPMAPYGVTKAALWTMTRYLAKECAPKVRVNAVCPGTTSADGSVTFASWYTALPQVPLGRMGLAEETARAVLFLAGDAASYTTGQNLFVDGGRVNCLAGSVGGSELATGPPESPAG